MAAVKSRIPQGRPSKIPGGNSSRQSLQSNRFKFNNQARTADNLKLTNQQFVVEQPSDVNPLDPGSDFQESDENCEIVSLSSADPSPSKEIENFHDFDSSMKEDFHRNPGNHIQEENPIEHSAASSSGSSTGYRKTTHYGKNTSKSKIEATRPTSLKTRGNQLRPSSFKAKDNGKITNSSSFSNSTHLSAANAMDYVKKLTGHDVTIASGSSKHADEYSGRHSHETTRAISRANAHEKNRGKTSGISDEIKPRSISSRNEATKLGRSRSERRLLYQEAKERNLRNGDEAMHELDESTAMYCEVATNRPKQSSEIQRAGGRSPRIARPVTRPPRGRTSDATQEERRRDGKLSSKQQDDASQERDTESGFIDSVMRRGSVPVTSVGGQRQQRRRASAMTRVSQNPSTETNSAQSLAPATGDTDDFKDRLRQKERYRNILDNPDIVTYGHYRLIQEGNYAPEEKYGVTERRRIRSSTDSDTVSPTRGRNLSFLEQDNDTPSNVIRPLSSLNNGDVTEASSSCNEVTNENEVSVHDDHMTDDLSHTLMNNNLSLDNTALMCDVTITNSTAPVAKSHVTKHNHSSESEKLPMTSAPEQDVRKGHGEQGNSLVHSSSLRCRAASDDISKFNEAAATATSSGYLKSALDELTGEYKLVRVALEELYNRLNEEENEKTKLEEVVEKLRAKNSTLHEEINQMTRILEFQHASPSKQRAHHSTQNVETQTETSGTWYKTELRTMREDLAAAVEEIRKAKEMKTLFDARVAFAEEKLEVLLTEFQKICY